MTPVDSEHTQSSDIKHHYINFPKFDDKTLGVGGGGVKTNNF